MAVFTITGLWMPKKRWAKMIEGKSLSEVQKLARELTLRIVD